MNIVTGECNVPYYSRMSFKLWSTDLKEKLDERTIAFNQVEQDNLFMEWRNRFGNLYFLNHNGGFRHAGQE